MGQEIRNIRYELEKLIEGLFPEGKPEGDQERLITPHHEGSVGVEGSVVYGSNIAGERGYSVIIDRSDPDINVGSSWVVHVNEGSDGMCGELAAIYIAYPSEGDRGDIELKQLYPLSDSRHAENEMTASDIDQLGLLRDSLMRLTSSSTGQQKMTIW